MARRHGSHDICRASSGYPIYRGLRNRYARELGGRLRVWQVSHLWGHRDAPSLLDMPEGRNWVRLGVDGLSGSSPRVDCLTGERSVEVPQYEVTHLSHVG